MMYWVQLWRDAIGQLYLFPAWKCFHLKSVVTRKVNMRELSDLAERSQWILTRILQQVFQPNTLRWGRHWPVGLQRWQSKRQGSLVSFSPLILWGIGSRFLNITGSHGCSWGWSRKNSPVPGVPGKTGEDRGPKVVWELKCRLRERRTEVRRKDLRTWTLPWWLWRTHLQTGILAAKAISSFVCHFSDSMFLCVASCLLNSIPDNLVMRTLAGTLVSYVMGPQED